MQASQDRRSRGLLLPGTGSVAWACLASLCGKAANRGRYSLAEGEPFSLPCKPSRTRSRATPWAGQRPCLRRELLLGLPGKPPWRFRGRLSLATRPPFHAKRGRLKALPWLQTSIAGGPQRRLQLGSKPAVLEHASLAAARKLRGQPPHAKLNGARPQVSTCAALCYATATGLDRSLQACPASEGNPKP